MSKKRLIRPASYEDIQKIIPLAEHLSDNHLKYDPTRFVAPEDIKGVYEYWVSRAISEGNMLVLIVEYQQEHDDNEIIGYLVAEAIPAQPEYWSTAHVYIHDVFVRPEERDRSIGISMVEVTKDWAISRNIFQLRGLIAVSNHGAQSFFENIGFRKTAIEVNLDIYKMYLNN